MSVRPCQARSDQDGSVQLNRTLDEFNGSERARLMPCACLWSTASFFFLPTMAGRQRATCLDS